MFHAGIEAPHLPGAEGEGGGADGEGECEGVGEGIEADAEALEELAADTDHGGVDGDVLGDFFFGWGESNGAEHPSDAGAGVGDAIDGGDAQELVVIGDEDEAEGIEGEECEGEAGAADSAEAIHQESGGKEHADEGELIGDLGAAADLVIIQIELGGDEDGEERVADHPADAIDHVGGFVAGKDGIGLEDFAGVGDGFDDALPHGAAIWRGVVPATFAEDLKEAEDEEDAHELDQGGDGEVVAKGGGISMQPLAETETDEGTGDHGAAGDDAVHAAAGGGGIDGVEEFAGGGVIASAADAGDEMADDEPPEVGKEGDEGQGEAGDEPIDGEVTLEGGAVVEVIPEDGEGEEDGGGGGDDEGLPVAGVKLLAGEDGEDEDGGKGRALDERDRGDVHRHEGKSWGWREVGIEGWA